MFTEWWLTRFFMSNWLKIQNVNSQKLPGMPHTKIRICGLLKHATKQPIWSKSSSFCNCLFKSILCLNQWFFNKVVQSKTCFCPRQDNNFYVGHFTKETNLNQSFKCSVRHQCESSQNFRKKPPRPFPYTYHKTTWVKNSFFFPYN